MNITQSISGENCDVIFSGTFTFSDTMPFSEVINMVKTSAIGHFVFHINKLEFIDSSGLGMLLLARDAAKEQQKTLVLKGLQGQVKKVFEMACFGQYFTVNEV